MFYLVASSAAIVVTLFLLYRAYFATYHFATVQSGALYRDGNRSAHEFLTALRKSRAKTVVMLVDDTEIAHPIFVREIAQCDTLGINIERIVIPLGGWPTGDQVRQFIVIVTDKSRQPVLVHCAQGVRRTGMMVAAYQESILGYDNARTKSLIMRFGHSDRSINDVKRFIDIYDPRERQTLEELPLSVE